MSLRVDPSPNLYTGGTCELNPDIAAGQPAVTLPDGSDARLLDFNVNPFGQIDGPHAPVSQDISQAIGPAMNLFCMKLENLARHAVDVPFQR